MLSEGKSNQYCTERTLFSLNIGGIFVFVEGKIKTREITNIFAVSSDKETDDCPSVIVPCSVTFFKFCVHCFATELNQINAKVMEKDFHLVTDSFCLYG